MNNPSMEKMTLAEKEALEREEARKKKKSELDKLTGENYMIAAGKEYFAAEAKRKADENALLDQLYKDYAKMLPYLHEEVRQTFEYGRECKKRAKALFDPREEIAEEKQIKEKLDKVKLTNRNYRTIATCIATKMSSKVQDFIVTGELKEQDKSEIKKTRDEAMAKAKECLEDIEKQAYEGVAATLVDNLKTSLKQFEIEKDPKKAYAISTDIKNILEIVQAKPEIAKYKDFTKELAEQSKEAAYYGIAIREGLDAMDKMEKAALKNNGKTPDLLTPRTEKDYAIDQINMVKVMNMKVIMDTKKYQLAAKERVFSREVVEKGAVAINKILEDKR